MLASNRTRRSTGSYSIWLSLIAIILPLVSNNASGEPPIGLFQQYCFDCHDGDSEQLNLSPLLTDEHFDGSLIFENLATGKMPPADAEQPSPADRRSLLTWLAGREEKVAPPSFRRLSRHEFIQSVNDLLGIQLDLTDKLPEDRGTNDFSSNRQIAMSNESLRAYFMAADEMLEYALPEKGFPEEQIWETRKIRDSHSTYKIYVRDYKEGLLYSWTRANNGNSYSFFYDGFEPPSAGWYKLTFDAAKVGDFPEDVSIQVHAGKYYFADDRPQPQRLLRVISVGNRELKPHTIRVFLRTGENVSVHCYSEHTWRKKSPQQGAYIKQLKVRGPLQSHTLESTTSDEQGVSSEANFAAATKEDLRQCIKRFAERAFVTRLKDDALAPYLEVSLDNLQRHGDFKRATKVGLKAILCSPRFIMVPGEHANASFSKASHLARVLWLSVPDRELQSLASRNELSDQQLPQQIDRMLQDRRSKRMIQSICDQWLNLRSWNKVTPSLKLYPSYDDLLDHFLPEETKMYLAYLIRNNMPVRHLIDSDYAFLNQRLSKHYGIEPLIGQQLRRVTLPANSPRGGLLTMGSVLKVTTDGFHTSPILRGAWVSKNIAGTPISPPPATVKAIEPEHGNSGGTLREQIDQHKTNPSCYACHKHIDPYGFALENFDAIGQHRTKYRVHESHKGTFQFRRQGYYHLAGDVDASGELAGDSFRDIADLKDLLLSNQRKTAYHFAKKFFEYANGIKPNLEQRLAIYEMIPENAEACRMKDLITAVLTYSVAGEQP